MTLRAKLLADLYLGGVLQALLKPPTVLLGKILRREHNLGNCSSLTFIKMMGGGSLVIACLTDIPNTSPELLSALAALRQQHGSRQGEHTLDAPPVGFFVGGEEPRDHSTGIRGAALPNDVGRCRVVRDPVDPGTQRALAIPAAKLRQSARRISWPRSRRLSGSAS